MASDSAPTQTAMETLAEKVPSSNNSSNTPMAKKCEAENARGHQDLDNDDTHIIYPSGVKFASICISLCLSVVLVGLDSTMITTAIPTITDEFKSTDDVGWYGAAFRLASCITQLSQGKLFNNYPVRWVFLVNLGIFELGNLVSAISPNSIAFILGRAITGVGFSGISQGVMMIIVLARPLGQRPKFIGLISASEFLAIALGPLIGGAITHSISWRWCFYITLPISVLPAVVILVLFKEPKHKTRNSMSTKDKLKDLDLSGMLFFGGAIICLLLGLEWGGSTFAWSNARIIALLVLAPILFAVFVSIQLRKQESAMLPPHIAKNKAIIVGSCYALSETSTNAVMQYYIPIWFQAVKGASSIGSGIMSLPMVLGTLVSAVIAGFAIERVGYYSPFAIPASCLVLAGTAMTSQLHHDTSSAFWIPALALIGLGIGTGVALPFLAAQTVLAPDEVSIGMAMMTFAQDFGAALFVGVAQPIFYNSLGSSLETLVPELNSSYVIDQGSQGLKGFIPFKYLEAVQVSYDQAVVKTFYLAIALAACILISAIFTKRKAIKRDDD